MSEEIEILLAAKSFHELLGDMLEALDDKWLSQVQGRMRPGGRIGFGSCLFLVVTLSHTCNR